MGLGNILKAAAPLYGGFATGTGLLGAGAIAGIGQGLGAGPPPTHQTANLDEESQNLIRDQKARGDRSLDDIANERLSGVDQGDELGRASNDLAMRNPGSSGESGDNESLRQALSNRSRRSYARDLTQIKRQTQNQAADIKMRQTAQAYENISNQQKVMSGISRRKQAEREANDKMRREVINTAIGVGGTVAGAMLGARSGGGKPASDTGTGASDSSSMQGWSQSQSNGYSANGMRS